MALPLYSIYTNGDCRFDWSIDKARRVTPGGPFKIGSIGGLDSLGGTLHLQLIVSAVCTHKTHKQFISLDLEFRVRVKLFSRVIRPWALQNTRSALIGSLREHERTNNVETFTKYAIFHNE